MRTVQVEILASKYSRSPFEVLMDIAMGDWKKLGFKSKTKTTFTMNGIEVEEENIPLKERCNAAQACCRYLYPQKHRIEMTKEEALKVLENELNSGGISDLSQSEEPASSEGE